MSRTGAATRRSCCSALARPEFYDSRPTWGGGKLNATAMLLSGAGRCRHRQPGGQARPAGSGAAPHRRRRWRQSPVREQLVAMLMDEGHVALADGVATWIGGPPSDVTWAMPPSVSALLAARIDRLARRRAHHRGLCRRDRHGVLCRGDRHPDRHPAAGSAASSSALLVRKELLRTAVTDLPGLTAYRFLHVLVRDAAYDGLAKASRAAWHEQLADWLSSLGLATSCRTRSWGTISPRPGSTATQSAPPPTGPRPGGPGRPDAGRRGSAARAVRHRRGGRAAAAGGRHARAG